MAKGRRRAPVAPAPRPLGARVSPGWLLALAAAVIVAFAPALHAPFVFDDLDGIARNPTLAHLWPLSGPLMPPPRTAVSGRPVVNLTLAINHALSSSSAATFGYHVVNLLIHVACGLLLLGVIRRTLTSPVVADWIRERADAIALATVALWLVHPIQTEAVDYVIQRTELLVSLCYLATLYASIRGWYVAGFVACLAGMGCKEVMVSAPLAVVLYDRVFRAASWKEVFADRTRRRYYAALASTLVVLGALIAGGGRADSVGFALGLPWYRYLYGQGWAIAHYLWLVVWPRDLRFDYGDQVIFGWATVLGWCVILAAAAATIAAWRRDRWRPLAYLGAWFFLLLAPSSSLVPIRTEIAAERRVYLASAAIFVGLVIAIAAALRRVKQPSWSRAIPGVFAAVVVALVALSFRRSMLYAEPEGLWRDAVAKAPANARAYDNLAAVVLASDRQHEAEADSLWTRAIAIDSTYMPAWSNLAQVRVDAGRLDEASALLEHAVRINPDYVDATQRLGGLLARRGDVRRALPYLERVASSGRATDETFVILAVAYLQAARSADAVAALRNALRLNPARADAAGYLGVLLAEAGQFDEAVPYLEIAARNGDENGMTYSILSLAYAQMGRGNESMHMAEQAAARAHGDARIYVVIGRAMMALSRPEDAVVYFANAVDAAPNDPEAITRLGIARAASGDTIAAIALFRRALAVSPGYGPAVQALAKATSR